ncbi:MAG: hypothetical protein FWD80_06220 [Propionibacteriaceae bacterium]|nr:hypothetical protein [Propionibacteriaceae bacterium]
MSNLADFNAAISAAYDPNTNASDLAIIAQLHPELRHLVAGHCNADVSLLTWLDGLGDPNISQIIARRRAPVAQSLPAHDRQTPHRQWPKPWIAVTAVLAVAAVALAVPLFAGSPAVPAATPDQPGPPIPAPTVTVTETPTPPPAIKWKRTYGGEGADQFNAVAVTSDGSIIVAGTTTSTDGDFAATHKGQDAVVAKLTPDGDITWAKTYGGNGDDAFNAVTIGRDGNIIVAGTTSSTNGDFPIKLGGTSDAVIATLSLDGSIVWVKTFGGDGDSSFASVAVWLDGYIAAVGTTTSTTGDFAPTHGGQDATLVTLSPDGEINTIKAYGGSGDDSFAGVAIAADKGIVAVGKTNSQDGDFPVLYGGVDAVVAKVDPTGTITKAKAYGGSKDDELNGVAAAPGGGLAAVGATGSTDGNMSDISTNDPQVAISCQITDDGAAYFKGEMSGTSGRAMYTAVAISDGGIAAVAGSGDTAAADGTYGPPTMLLGLRRMPGFGGAFTMFGDQGTLAGVAISGDGDMIFVGKTSSASDDAVVLLMH